MSESLIFPLRFLKDILLIVSLIIIFVYHMFDVRSLLTV